MTEEIRKAQELQRRNADIKRRNAERIAEKEARENDLRVSDQMELAKSANQHRKVFDYEAKKRETDPNAEAGHTSLDARLKSESGGWFGAS